MYTKSNFLLSLCIHSHVCQIEPTFNFETPNITIPEPNGPAEICITMTGRTTVPISVTATTGPKRGAPDQATGKEWAPLGVGWIGYSLNTQSRFIMFTQLVRTTTVPPSRWNSHPVMREQQDAVLMCQLLMTDLAMSQLNHSLFHLSAFLPQDDKAQIEKPVFLLRMMMVCKITLTTCMEIQ